MLADTIAYPTTVRPVAARTLGKDEEIEKRLATALRSGQLFVFLDNISGEVESDMLCQAITQPLVTFRLLGKTEEMTIENAAIFLLTGNNLIIVGDLTRRILRSKIDPQTERPEDRVFTTTRPDKLAAEYGPLYVYAALTILRAFHVAGRPSTTKPLGSFEDWSKLVRDCLIWLGEPDPCLVMEAVRFDDPKRERNLAALTAWYKEFQHDATTSKDVIETAKIRIETNSGGYQPGTPPGYKFSVLRDAVLAVTDGELNSTELGEWASSIKDRIIGDYK